ncbi:hypothetical protein [Streptomyces sp. I05A-00742]|uniref:hypothetical protein n=1 Tax=Streptomyces sp. I05A-00742 TaxID=2732853 RepID=UPI001489ADF2|nr:hypothetical protein [Streptomyces sp. I05A-00742]
MPAQRRRHPVRHRRDVFARPGTGIRHAYRAASAAAGLVAAFVPLDNDGPDLIVIVGTHTERSPWTSVN